LIGWVLSFGHEAKVVRPGWIVKQIIDITKKLFVKYQGKE